MKKVFAHSNVERQKILTELEHSLEKRLELLTPEMLETLKEKIANVEQKRWEEEERKRREEEEKRREEERRKAEEERVKKEKAEKRKRCREHLVKIVKCVSICAAGICAVGLLHGAAVHRSQSE